MCCVVINSGVFSSLLAGRFMVLTESVLDLVLLLLLLLVVVVVVVVGGGVSV